MRKTESFKSAKYTEYRKIRIRWEYDFKSQSGYVYWDYAWMNDWYYKLVAVY